MTSRLRILIEVDAKTGDVKSLNRDIDDMEKKSGRAGMALGNLKTAVVGLAAGAVGAGIVIQKTWDNLKDVAALELAASQFDNLTASIGTTSEAMLDEFKQATSGMMSDAQMINSASQIISLGLADNQEDVIRLANLVGQLGWDMNQVIMTFANNSKMRLDALGLSVTDVETRMKALEAQGLNTDKAFDMAVIEAGEAKLELLGSAADSLAGDLAKAEAAQENFTNSIKRWIALRQGAVIIGVSNTIEVLTKAQDDLLLAQQLGLITTREWIFLEQEIGKVTSDHKDEIRELGEEARAYEQQLARVDSKLANYIDSTKEATTSIDRMSAQQMEAIQSAQQSSKTYQEYADDLDAAKKAASELADQQAELAAMTGGMFMDNLNNADDALVQWSRTVTTAGGRTEIQSENLSDLEREYNRLTTSIRSYESGSKSVLVEEDKRAEKLEELRGQLVAVEGAMGPLAAISKEVTGINEGLVVNTDALGGAMMDAAAAAGADKHELALLGVVTGELTIAQADALLKTVLLEEGIGRLSGAYAAGEISADQLRNQVMALAEEINNMPTDHTIAFHSDLSDFEIPGGFGGVPVAGDVEGGLPGFPPPSNGGGPSPPPPSAPPGPPRNLPEGGRGRGGTTVNVNVFGPMQSSPRAIAGAVANVLTPRG